MSRLDSLSRRNIALHIVDGSLFMSGMVFFETTTIMVAFIKRIYDNAFIIGAIPALMIIGFNVPGIVSTIFAERFKKRKTFIRVFAFFQRFAMLGLSMSTFLIGLFSPPVTALIVLLVFFLFPFFGGIGTPAWLDFVGKTVPETHRARTQGTRNFLSSLGGIFLPYAIGRIFASYAYPESFRVSFFIAFLLVFASLVAFLFIREETESPVPPGRSLSSYFKALYDITRENANFRSLLIARATLSLSACGGAFYTAYSFDYYGRVDDGLVILYTFALNASKAGASLLFGFAGDRFGNLLVQKIGAFVTALTLLVAVFIPHPVTFVIIFALFGISFMADLNGTQVLITEFGDDRDRLLYTTIGSSVIGITGGIVPLAGGAMLASGVIGYKALFGLSSVFALVSLFLYIFTVKDPKRAVFDRNQKSNKMTRSDDSATEAKF